MPTPRFLRLFLAALISVFIAAPALAAPDPVQMAWVRGPGAEGCASQRAIVDRVTARLGRNPFSTDAGQTIDVYATRSEAYWRAEIFVRDRDGKLVGTRELTSEAPDCAAIEEAVVLALVLTIDVDAVARPPAAPPAAPAAIPPPLPPPAPWIPVPRAPPVRPAEVLPPVRIRLGSFGLSLRGGVGWGLIPGAAPGISLASYFAVARRASIAVEALYLPESRTRDDRFSFGLSAVSIGGCFDLIHGDAVELASCGSLWAGSLHAVVFALRPAEPGDRAWAAAALTPRLRVGVGSHAHLELGANLFVPFVRRAFTINDGADRVFQETPVAVLPFLGAGANFL